MLLEMLNHPVIFMGLVFVVVCLPGRWFYLKQYAVKIFQKAVKKC